uniref:Shieldin complex subunit 3 n=1 Tax=Nothobranchius furzeri TaxID=105023 RepID=A0A8C6KV44_NOTFU
MSENAKNISFCSLPDQLSCLLERTEKLLKPFTCRSPPAFSPWFPISTAAHRLPIRPAKPAPVITSGDFLADDPKSNKDPLFMDRDASPIRRSWSVFTQRRVLLQNPQSLSRQFDHMVSVHGLHLRQRAKWVITQDNCGDIEKVWRSLSRSVQSSRLPTCNANIQRERAEIWVFCDLLYSEQVGRHLKDELKLVGRVSLSVHKLGNIFSM